MRWGIIGAGEIAARGFAPALAQLGGGRLASVYNRSLDKAQAFAQRFAAPRAVDAVGQLLADPEVEAVYVATPNSLHPEHVVAAARAGKHVLCEKPMAIRVADGERMIEACERAGVRLGTMYQNRYHPAHFEAQRHVASGATGEIQYASAQLCRGYARGGHWSGWRVDPAMTGSGAIVAQAVHPIDLLRFILGAEVTEVQAMSDEMRSGASGGNAVEEMVYCQLRFSSGAHATVVAGTLLPRYDNDVVLYGERGKVVCRGTLGVPLGKRTGEITLETDGASQRLDYPLSTVADKMAKLVAGFEQAVQSGAEPPVSGANGLQMIRIADALQVAARSGRAVKL